MRGQPNAGREAGLSEGVWLPMLIPKTRTAADYRLQAAHIREFLETVHDDELRNVLLNVVQRLDLLAEGQAAPV